MTLNGLAVLRDNDPLDTRRIRKPLALLAVVAAAGTDGVSRDKLQAVFWPESDATRARGALKQAHYLLRQTLGVDPWITRGAHLTHDSDAVTADVIEFRRALTEGRLEAAVDLYRGPFLDGVFLRDLPAFEECVDAERSRLRQSCAAALARLAEDATQRGERQGVVEWRRRLVEFDSLDNRSTLLYIEALLATGAREQALRAARTHIAMVRAELDGDPDEAIVRKAEFLARTTAEEGVEAAPFLTPARPVAGVPREPTRRTPRRAIWIGAVAVGLVAAGALWRARRANAPAPAAATGSAEARAYYQRAQASFALSLTERDLLATAQLFSSATLHNPSYAAAWAGLSRTHSELYWSYYDRSAERLGAAREAAERALRLDPSSPDGHLALGYYYYYGFLKYDEALTEFEAARRVASDRADIIEAMAYAERRQGKWPEAVAHLERAVRLDSLSYTTAAALGDTYRRLRRAPDAERMLRRAIVLRPTQADAYVTLAELELGSAPSREPARAALEGALGHVDAPALTRAAMLSGGVLIRVFPMEFDSELRRSNAAAFGAQPEMYFLGRGTADGALGNATLATAYFDSARAILEPKAAANGDMLAFYHDMLAVAYAGEGRARDALREVGVSVNLLPTTRDASNGPNVRFFLATVYAMSGNMSAAREEIDSLLARPSLVEARMLDADPLWVGWRARKPVVLGRDATRQ